MKIIKLTINHHNKIANNRNWVCVCVYPTFAISRFANKLKHAHSLYPSSNNNNNNNTNRFVYSEVSAKLDLYTYPPIYRWKKNQLQIIIKHSQFLLLQILIDWRFRRSFEYDKVRQSKANEHTTFESFWCLVWGIRINEITHAAHTRHTSHLFSLSFTLTICNHSSVAVFRIYVQKLGRNREIITILY